MWLFLCLLINLEGICLILVCTYISMYTVLYMWSTCLWRNCNHVYKSKYVYAINIYVEVSSICLNGLNWTNVCEDHQSPSCIQKTDCNKLMT